MKRFKLRIKAAYRILFKKYKHWVILDVSDDNIVKLLKDDEFEADVLYHGVQPYVFYRMIKSVGNHIDDIDMCLMKAKFEAEAMAFKRK